MAYLSKETQFKASIFKSTNCLYIRNSSWVLMDVLLRACSFVQNVDIAQYWQLERASVTRNGFRNFARSVFTAWWSFWTWGSIWQVGAPDCLETIPLSVAPLCIQFTRHACRHVPFVVPHQGNCYHYHFVVTVTAVDLIFCHKALCCTLVYQNTRRATLLHIPYFIQNNEQWTSGL